MCVVARLFATCLVASFSTGCSSSYVVPGGPANMTAMRTPIAGDGTAAGAAISAFARPVPMATFPALLAVARVQASGYRSQTASGYGVGAYSVITTRDVETDDAFARIMKLPGVAGVAQLNRLLLPPNLQSESDLRRAAGRVNADILIMYTFDTEFYDKDYAAPLTVVTLGLSPSKRAFVTTTATALIVDARTGYVYGGAESTEKSDQAANAWTTDDAVDDTRRRTETRAFEKLISELEKTWPTIVAQYSKPTTMP